MLKQMASCHPITENMHVRITPQLNRCDPVIYALLLDGHCDPVTGIKQSTEHLLIRTNGLFSHLVLLK